MRASNGGTTRADAQANGSADGGDDACESNGVASSANEGDTSDHADRADGARDDEIMTSSALEEDASEQVESAGDSRGDLSSADDRLDDDVDVGRDGDNANDAEPQGRDVEEDSVVESRSDSRVRRQLVEGLHAVHGDEDERLDDLSQCVGSLTKSSSEGRPNILSSTISGREASQTADPPAASHPDPSAHRSRSFAELSTIDASMTNRTTTRATTSLSSFLPRSRLTWRAVM